MRDEIDLESLIPSQDKYYIFDENLVSIIDKSINYNLKLMIYGPHGSGKSTHIEQICAIKKLPCIRINFDNNILRSDLVGKDTIYTKDNKQVIVFKEGILPFAMKHGIVLILDEYDSARPETLFVLQKVLERNGKLFLFEENKEVKPHKNFRIFATANTIGLGDESGYYSGTQMINQSNLDRWDIIAKSNYLTKDKEIEFITKYFFTDYTDNNQNINYYGFNINTITKHFDEKSISTMPRKIVSLANLIRNSFANSDLSVTFSTINLISFCSNLFLFLDYQQAFELSYLNRLNDKIEIDQANQLFQNCFDLTTKS